MRTMRLDKAITHSTALSRSEASREIGRGHVRVNDVVVRDPGRHVDVSTDRIELNREPLHYRGAIYLMLNKPTGVVCSTEDRDNPTILTLLPEPLRVRAPHATGRLDLDATGLVLLTDDGQWSHALRSPRRHVQKVYRVTTADPIDADAVKQFADGIMLAGEEKPTLPAALVLEGPNQGLVTIEEGRYHQVKRMFGAIGNRVESLHRIQVGALKLDPALAPGDWRELTPEEVRLAVASEDGDER